jgi:cob(I)alamin adenosyltransferase
MTENEKLRALLKEARACLFNLGADSATAYYEHGDCLAYKKAEDEAAEIHARIDEVLAEPVEESDGSACPQCGCDACEAGRAEYEKTP